MHRCHALEMRSISAQCETEISRKGAKAQRSRCSLTKTPMHFEQEVTEETELQSMLLCSLRYLLFKCLKFDVYFAPLRET